MNFIIRHSLVVFLIPISLLLALFGEDTTKYFIYNRDAINDGEFWRFFTAHLTHLDWNHLWLNLSALVIIWFLIYEFLSISCWWLVTFVTCFGISLCLYLFMNDLQWYVGLSGLLHGLLVCGAILGAAKKRKEFILLLIFITIKIIYEQFYDSINSELIDAVVIVNAHLYGAVIGLSYALLFLISKRFKSTDS